jgi:hemolysin III
MKIKIDVKQYSKGEEIANSVIHGVGALLGIVGLTILLVLASINDSSIHFVSYLIYGISLIFLYTSSTLYHALPFVKAKTLFKLLDHIGIYLLIAGTYTPFLVLHLSEKWSLWMLISIWTFCFCRHYF